MSISHFPKYILYKLLSDLQKRIFYLEHIHLFMSGVKSTWHLMQKKITEIVKHSDYLGHAKPGTSLDDSI